MPRAIPLPPAAAPRTLARTAPTPPDAAAPTAALMRLLPPLPMPMPMPMPRGGSLVLCSSSPQLPTSPLLAVFLSLCLALLPSSLSSSLLRMSVCPTRLPPAVPSPVSASPANPAPDPPRGGALGPAWAA